jgi:hypothetical protein
LERKQIAGHDRETLEHDPLEIARAEENSQPSIRMVVVVTYPFVLQ